MSKKGVFIVFEGIDGSGKTTQVDLLAAALTEKGRDVVICRDPGGTGLGEGLRNVLLYSPGPIDPVAEALMYGAARAQLVAERILPAVRGGSVVISDRFSHSMLAYQGWGKGLDRGFLENVNRYACRGLTPDLTVLLEIDPLLAISRLTRPADRMEKEGVGFLRRVRNGFLALAQESPHHYLVLDSAAPAEELFLRVLAAVYGILG
ncbi:MAG: hypothetical protein VR68_07520 [Peptococcaceae bacterium BRH_c4a]|nr:MAG: hypothetical protein VR68_07520 [Peptococcaceae bacterium BRH_c4a]